jgi:hypothetical protein
MGQIDLRGRLSDPSHRLSVHILDCVRQVQQKAVMGGLG